MKKKRTQGRRARKQRPRPARAFVATSNDALAAFLVLRGCRSVGISSEQRSPTRSVAAHAFEDEADKLLFAVSAFQAAEGDDVPAGQFVATLNHLRRIRRDADLRLRSDSADEIDRLRILEEDVQAWESKRR